MTNPVTIQLGQPDQYGQSELTILEVRMTNPVTIQLGQPDQYGQSDHRTNMVNPTMSTSPIWSTIYWWLPILFPYFSPTAIPNYQFGQQNQRRVNKISGDYQYGHHILVPQKTQLNIWIVLHNILLKYILPILQIINLNLWHRREGKSMSKLQRVKLHGVYCTVPNVPISFPLHTNRTSSTNGR